MSSYLRHSHELHLVQGNLSARRNDRGSLRDAYIRSLILPPSDTQGGNDTGPHPTGTGNQLSSDQAIYYFSNNSDVLYDEYHRADGDVLGLCGEENHLMSQLVLDIEEVNRSSNGGRPRRAGATDTGFLNQLPPGVR